jgi:hypothetical protein
MSDDVHPPESKTSSPSPARINGRFAKGVSGNPGGKPKELRGIQHLARTHAQRMIEVLAEIAENEKATPAARATCAVALLDRGFGKPKETIDANISNAVRNASELTDEQLADIIALGTGGGSEGDSAPSPDPQ